MNFVVELTPAGRGAVAAILVEGPAATSLVDESFSAANGRPLARQAIGRILFGRWESATGEAPAGEEVVVCRRTAARVEIHCHGGGAAARAVGDDLVRRGGRRMAWQTWVEQGENDPIRGAARIALAAARTSPAAEILLDQYQGALESAIDEAIRSIDRDDGQSARRTVEALLDWAPLGLHLGRPWQVVIAGRPNVGKSSLLNALMGFARAIVCDQPGTTRDVVTATTAIDGWPVQLADTAGLHAADDPTERAGIALARQQLAAADLVILVEEAICDDPQQILPRLEREARRLRPSVPALLVMSKCDLLTAGEVAPPPLIATSTIDGRGINDLIAAIGRTLVPEQPPPGTAVPFTQQQVESLRQAKRALDEGDLPSARAALASIESKRHALT